MKNENEKVHDTTHTQRLGCLNEATYDCKLDEIRCWFLEKKLKRKAKKKIQVFKIIFV